MAKKIHLAAVAEDYINRRTHHSEPPLLARHVAAAFEQLNHISATSRPELSDDDWREIYNIYAGSDLTVLRLPLNLAADLLDHYGATDQNRLPKNCTALFNTLAALPQAQQFAVIDAARLFWASID